MLDEKELNEILRKFNTNEPQVQKDYAISQILFGLQQIKAPMVFFGGTALARTILPDGRLSEDIDLYTESRNSLSLEMDGLPELIRKEFPSASWEKLPSNVFDAQDLYLNCEASIRVKIQIVESQTRRLEFVPTNVSPIFQRYSDIPTTKLRVPSLDGFVAMKSLAWFDRHAARDLFDLAGLSKIASVTSNARQVIEHIRGYALNRAMLNLKSTGDWVEELSHQTNLQVTEQECLQNVLDWWSVGVTD